MKNKKRLLYYFWSILVTFAFVFIVTAKVLGIFPWKLYDLIGIPSALFLVVILLAKFINDDYEEE